MLSFKNLNPTPVKVCEICKVRVQYVHAYVHDIYAYVNVLILYITQTYRRPMLNYDCT